MNKELSQEESKMQALAQRLLAIEEDREAGKPGCTVDELDAYLNEIIKKD